MFVGASGLLFLRSEPWMAEQEERLTLAQGCASVKSKRLQTVTTEAENISQNEGERTDLWVIVRS